MKNQDKVKSIGKLDTKTMPLRKINVFVVNATAFKEKNTLNTTSKVPLTPPKSGADSILADSSISETGFGESID